MKNEKIRILYEKQKFMADKNAEYVKLERDKEEYKRNLSQIEDLLFKESEIVDLDIGGTHRVTTSKKTLCKFPNSSLAALFSGRHKLQVHNSRYFIDREGEIFMLVIEYLRNGKLPFFLNKNDENKFFEELDYWNISSSHLSNKNNS